MVARSQVDLPGRMHSLSTPPPSVPEASTSAPASGAALAGVVGSPHAATKIPSAAAVATLRRTAHRNDVTFVKLSKLHAASQKRGIGNRVPALQRSLAQVEPSSKHGGLVRARRARAGRGNGPTLDGRGRDVKYAWDDGPTRYRESLRRGAALPPDRINARSTARAADSTPQEPARASGRCADGAIPVGVAPRHLEFQPAFAFCRRALVVLAHDEFIHHRRARNTPAAGDAPVPWGPHSERGRT